MTKSVDFKIEETIGISHINPSAVSRLRLIDDRWDRCPHDGGYCGRGCLTSCFRKETSASLLKPWPGYPIDSKQFFEEKQIREVMES